MWPPMIDILKEQQSFDSIKYLNISGDMSNVIILPNEGNECIVSIGGADEFVQNSSIYQRGNELYIETPDSKSNIHINMNSIWATTARRRFWIH